jgi:hypothetical protein
VDGSRREPVVTLLAEIAENLLQETERVVATLQEDAAVIVDVEAESRAAISGLDHARKGRKRAFRWVEISKPSGLMGLDRVKNVDRQVPVAAPTLVASTLSLGIP